ncbi:MAG: glycosyltransferase family 9 protein [Deltaproteobacteria bacterium]|nr:glycosyltransferase family 9 protein [Deltaproteobacteria bacterium]
MLSENAIPQSFPTTFQPLQGGRLAIFHQGALGDFLLTCPVFEGIHLAFPQVVMDFWTREPHGKLIASRPYLGGLHIPDSTELSPFYHEEEWSRAPVPAALRRADGVLLFGQAGARRLAERLAVRLDRPVHWIQSFPDCGTPVPVTEFLVQQVRDRLGPIHAAPVELSLDPEECRRARSWLAKRLDSIEPGPLFIHPGSGGAAKIWPLARWWELLIWIREELRLPVVLTLGPADEKLERFACQAESLGVYVAQGLSLGGLSALLSQARFFVGGDSGVSHLAGALAVPSVVIFGPSDPRVWAPRGPSVRVVVERWTEGEIFQWSPLEREVTRGTEHVRSLVMQHVDVDRPCGEPRSEKGRREMEDG